MILKLIVVVFAQKRIFRNLLLDTFSELYICTDCDPQWIIQEIFKCIVSCIAHVMPILYKK